VGCLDAAMKAALALKGAASKGVSADGCTKFVAALGAVLSSGMICVAKQLFLLQSGRVGRSEEGGHVGSPMECSETVSFLFRVLDVCLRNCPRPLLYGRSRVGEGSCALVPILKGALGLSGADAQRMMALREAAVSAPHKKQVQFSGQLDKDHAGLDPVAHAIVTREIDRCMGTTLNLARTVLVELGTANDSFLKDQLTRLESIVQEGGVGGALDA